MIFYDGDVLLLSHQNMCGCRIWELAMRLGQISTFDTAAAFHPILRTNEFAPARLCLPGALPFDSSSHVEEVFSITICHFGLLDVRR
jgi:hypothetical protein